MGAISLRLKSMFPNRRRQNLPRQLPLASLAACTLRLGACPPLSPSLHPRRPQNGRLTSKENAGDRNVVRIDVRGARRGDHVGIYKHELPTARAPSFLSQRRAQLAIGRP